MRNVHIRDLHYSMECECSETSMDAGKIYKFDKLSAVYFNDPDCENITVQGITAGRSLTSVFGGKGNVSLSARDITYLNPETKLVDGEDINVEIE